MRYELAQTGPKDAKTGPPSLGETDNDSFQAHGLDAGQ